MNVVHCTAKGMKLCTGFSTFLKLPLKTTEDMLEGKAALPRRPHTATHTTHVNQATSLRYLGPTLLAGGKIERSGAVGVI